MIQCAMLMSTLCEDLSLIKKYEHLFPSFFLQALESFSTLIIKFRDEDQKASWLRGLTHATYQASVKLRSFCFFCSLG